MRFWCKMLGHKWRGPVYGFFCGAEFNEYMCTRCGERRIEKCKK